MKIKLKIEFYIEFEDTNVVDVRDSLCPFQNLVDDYGYCGTRLWFSRGSIHELGPMKGYQFKHSHNRRPKK